MNTTTLEGMEAREKEITRPIMERSRQGSNQAWYKLADFWNYIATTNREDAEDWAPSISEKTQKVDDSYLLENNIF